MEEDLKKSLEELSERDRRRLKELKARQEEGTLSYTENIEIDLLESQERIAKQVDEAFIKEEERSEFEKLRSGVLGKDPVEEEELVEFEYIPLEEEEVVVREPAPRPRPKIDVDPEKMKMAVAFGAGAMLGYFLKDFLEEELEEHDC